MLEIKCFKLKFQIFEIKSLKLEQLPFYLQSIVIITTTIISLFIEKLLEFHFLNEVRIPLPNKILIRFFHFKLCKYSPIKSLGSLLVIDFFYVFEFWVQTTCLTIAYQLSFVCLSAIILLQNNKTLHIWTELNFLLFCCCYFLVVFNMDFIVMQFFIFIFGI